MSVTHCESCGGTNLKMRDTRVVHGSRRRSYVCNDCGSAFSTLEVRLPPGIESGPLSAKLKEWIRKERA